MKKNQIYDKILLIGTIFFLTLISIGFITTNIESRSLIISIRYASIAITAICISIILIMKKISYTSFIAIIVYLFLLTWGLLLSYLNDAIHIASHDLARNIAITTCGLILIASKEKEVLNTTISNYYVTYGLAGLIITITIGGLDLDFPPHFIYEYTSENYGGDVLYSQGVSQFFGICAISSASLLIKSIKKHTRYFLSVLTVIFLSLSLLGGARGDSIFSIATILMLLLIKNPFRLLISLILLTIAYYLLDSIDLSWLDKFTIFNRLSALESNYGHRDLLLNDAMRLLSSQSACLLTGCGFGFFQIFYGYEYGMYPHNFIAELVITFGIPISLTISLVVIYGIKIYWKKTRHMDLFLLLSFYSFLISLKSNTLLSNWLLMVAILYFSAIFIQKINSERIKN